MLPQEIRKNPSFVPQLRLIKAEPLSADFKKETDYQTNLNIINKSLKLLEEQNPYLVRFCDFIIDLKDQFSAMAYLNSHWLLNHILPDIAEPLGLNEAEQEALHQITNAFNQLMLPRTLHFEGEEEKHWLKILNNYPPTESPERQRLLGFIENAAKERIGIEQILDDMKPIPAKERNKAEIKMIKDELRILLDYLPPSLQDICLTAINDFTKQPNARKFHDARKFLEIMQYLSPAVGIKDKAKAALLPQVFQKLGGELLQNFDLYQFLSTGILHDYLLKLGRIDLVEEFFLPDPNDPGSLIAQINRLSEYIVDGQFNLNSLLQRIKPRSAGEIKANAAEPLGKLLKEITSLPDEKSFIFWRNYLFIKLSNLRKKPDPSEFHLILRLFRSLSIDAEKLLLDFGDSIFSEAFSLYKLLTSTKGTNKILVNHLIPKLDEEFIPYATDSPEFKQIITVIDQLNTKSFSDPAFLANMKPLNVKENKSIIEAYLKQMASYLNKIPKPVRNLITPIYNQFQTEQNAESYFPLSELVWDLNKFNLQNKNPKLEIADKDIPENLIRIMNRIGRLLYGQYDIYEAYIKTSVSINTYNESIIQSHFDRIVLERQKQLPKRRYARPRRFKLTPEKFLLFSAITLIPSIIGLLALNSYQHRQEVANQKPQITFLSASDLTFIVSVHNQGGIVINPGDSNPYTADDLFSAYKYISSRSKEKGVVIVKVLNPDGTLIEEGIDPYAAELLDVPQGSVVYPDNYPLTSPLKNNP